MSYKEKDETFFPVLTNMHIERGLKMLEREYKFAGNKEKFIKNIISLIWENYLPAMMFKNTMEKSIIFCQIIINL
jgi:hypothetical protein